MTSILDNITEAARHCTRQPTIAMSTAPVPATHKAPLIAIGKRSGLALLITVFLMLVTGLMEDTSIGRGVKMWTFSFLQRRLSPFESKQRLPILVVDISKIPGGKDEATSRDTLRQLIEAIIAQHPKAIAIDINFSPGTGGWKTDDDPAFFDFCLKMRERVPIFLAVYETSREPADTWLGLGKYKDLAAVAVVNKEDTGRMPRWIQQKGVSERLRSLSAALAETYEPSLPEPPRWLAGFVKVDSDQHHGFEWTEHETKLAQTLVNYSKLEQIQHETLSTTSSCSIQDEGENFSGKMVLLGDAKKFTDHFPVPGRQEAVAGIYLEASAAYTLAVEPLYEFNSMTRIAADLIISLVIILGVEWIRCRTLTGKRRLFRKRATWFLGAVILVVIFAGILLIMLGSIMWLDFLFVIFALLLHPSIESWLNKARKKLKRRKSVVGGVPI